MDEDSGVATIELVASNTPPGCCIDLSNLSYNAKNPEPERVLDSLEVPARFELANNGFADRGLTTWLRYHMK